MHCFVLSGGSGVVRADPQLETLRAVGTRRVHARTGGMAAARARSVVRSAALLRPPTSAEAVRLQRRRAAQYSADNQLAPSASLLAQVLSHPSGAGRPASAKQRALAAAEAAAAASCALSSAAALDDGTWCARCAQQLYGLSPHSTTTTCAADDAIMPKQLPRPASVGALPVRPRPASATQHCRGRAASAARLPDAPRWTLPLAPERPLSGLSRIGGAGVRADARPSTASAVAVPRPPAHILELQARLVEQAAAAGGRALERAWQLGDREPPRRPASAGRLPMPPELSAGVHAPVRVWPLSPSRQTMRAASQLTTPSVLETSSRRERIEKQQPLVPGSSRHRALCRLSLPAEPEEPKLGAVTTLSP